MTPDDEARAAVLGWIALSLGVALLCLLTWGAQ